MSSCSAPTRPSAACTRRSWSASPATGSRRWRCSASRSRRLGLGRSGFARARPADRRLRASWRRSRAPGRPHGSQEAARRRRLWHACRLPRLPARARPRTRSGSRCSARAALAVRWRAFFEPTSSAALPNLVEDDDLPTANVLIGSAWGVMLAVGAAIGGIVAATLGRDAAFVIDAATFAVSALLIIGITRPSSRRATRPKHGDRPAAAAGRLDPRRAPTSRATTGSCRRCCCQQDDVRCRNRRDPDARRVRRRRVPRGRCGHRPPLRGARAGRVGRPVRRPRARSARQIAGCWSGSRRRCSVRHRGVRAVSRWRRRSGSPRRWSSSPTSAAAASGCSRRYGLQRATPDAIRGRVFSFDYGLVTLTIALSTIVAGILSETLAPHAAVWTMVSLVAIAGLAWFWFSHARRSANAGRPRASGVYCAAKNKASIGTRASSAATASESPGQRLKARAVERPRRTTRERPVNRSGHRPLARHPESAGCQQSGGEGGWNRGRSRPLVLSNDDGRGVF